MSTPRASRSSPRPARPPGPAPIIDTDEVKGGTILRMRYDKGFGFIVADPPPGIDPGNADTEPEYFFHSSVVTTGREGFAALEAGDAVEFRAIASDRGPRAIVVRPL